MEDCRDPETNAQLSRALEEPWKNLSTQSNCIYWLLPCSNWLDSLIGPSGWWLLVVSLTFFFHLEKKLITKTWMWEICLQGSRTEHRWRCFRTHSCCCLLSIKSQKDLTAIVNQLPRAHREGWMDDKWSGNSFLLDSSSLVNHGGLAQLLFLYYLLTTDKQGGC
jgi:hypothetical protein